MVHRLVHHGGVLEKLKKIAVLEFVPTVQAQLDTLVADFEKRWPSTLAARHADLPR
jgi:hypothetical protein